MPQMAPYNWLMMFFLFNFIMMLIISHNHFLFTPNLPYNQIKLSKKFNWSW